MSGDKYPFRPVKPVPSKRRAPRVTCPQCGALVVRVDDVALCDTCRTEPPELPLETA